MAVTWGRDVAANVGTRPASLSSAPRREEGMVHLVAHAIPGTLLWRDLVGGRLFGA